MEFIKNAIKFLKKVFFGIDQEEDEREIVKKIVKKIKEEDL